MTDPDRPVDVAFLDCPYCGGEHHATLTEHQITSLRELHKAQAAACPKGPRP